MIFIVETYGDIGSGPTSSGGDGIGGMINDRGFGFSVRGDGVDYGNSRGDGCGSGHFDFDERD